MIRIQKLLEINKEQDVFDKVEIFSFNDERLKSLGELLSNESSRKILLMLTKQEMSANEFSEKIDLRLSAVIHHLNKMQQVGIVKISKMTKNSKNHDVKYYSAKHGIIIFPEETAKKAKKSKTFSNINKKIMRFSAIGISGLVSWLVAKSLVVKDQWQSGEELPSITSDDLFIPIIIGLGVIIIGLITERIFAFLKR